MGFSHHDSEDDRAMRSFARWTIAASSLWAILGIVIAVFS